MRWVLIVLPLLGACGATLPERVEIPVPVPCLRADQVPQRPALATEQLRAGASVHEKTKALLAENRQLKAYVAEMEVALPLCVQR
jgi:hypothetical protein